MHRFRAAVLPLGAAATGLGLAAAFVSRERFKQQIDALAGRVKGVKAIAEEIEVKLPFEIKRDDTDIATAASNRLAWDTGTPHDAVKVKVEKGWITLTGEVDWHFQKEAAEREVRNLLGVTGVSNQVTIKARVDTSHLQDDIQHALHRSIFFQPENVHVSASDGHVKLTGTVASWEDRRQAGWTAWAAPGATAVENDLIVA